MTGEGTPELTRWRVRDRALVMKAHQWFKNGDHPDDNCHMVTPDPDSTTQFEPFLSEGEVVRYFRHPVIPGDSLCPQDCGFTMHDHGWIDQASGRTVCPGDWVIGLARPSVGATAYFPVKPDVFAVICEPASPQPVTTTWLREQITSALAAWLWDDAGPAEATDAVMNVLEPAIGRITAETAALVRAEMAPGAAGEEPESAMPAIICLCGSTRFREVFEEAARLETVAGRIVLTVNEWGNDGHPEKAHLRDVAPDEKARLDELHKRKIDLAGEVLVVSDESGYYGDSTRSEIEYALTHGKPVTFMVEASRQRARLEGLLP